MENLGLSLKPQFNHGEHSGHGEKLGFQSFSCGHPTGNCGIPHKSMYFAVFAVVNCFF